MIEHILDVFLIIAFCVGIAAAASAALMSGLR